MDRVKFVPNIPQQLALSDVEGLLISEGWTDTVYYPTTDGRALYVHSNVAAKINMLDLRPGEPFCICKRWNGARGQSVRWDVWRAGESEKQRAAEEESEFESQLRASLDEVRSARQHPQLRPQPIAPAPEPKRTPPDHQAAPQPRKQPVQAKFPWADFLHAESRILTDVLAATLKYAGERYGAVLKAEDVRSLVITAFINLRQRGEAQNVA